MASADARNEARLKEATAAKAAAAAALDVAEKAKAKSAQGVMAAAKPFVGQTPVETALGRDIGKSVAQPTAAQRIATATTIRKTGTANNPIPYPAPAGANWNLYSGVWKLYYRGALIGNADGFDQSIIDSINTKATTGNTNNAGNGNNGNGNNNAGGTLTSVTDAAGPSTNITVLKSLLSSLGYSKTLVDSSTQYFMSLIAEGLDYDNIVSLYTDAKDYTLKNGQKVTSPFYEQYGYLNEGLTQPKSASALFNFVEGTKNLIKSYNISSKFAEPDALKKYIANNVTVEKLDERIMSAKLRTITADPQYVNTLRQLKYINNSEDLTDFFLDPKIGEAQLEINRKTASFATEALRRADKGISFNADALTRNAATLISQGRSEAQIADIANQGYETIAQTLQPSVGLSNIFEGANAANAQTIQTELEAEQFLGLESARRKKLKELGTNIFKQSTGMSTGRTVSYSNYSSAGQI
jgi:hypothetical protein